MPEALPDELEKGPETAKSVSLTGAENLQMFMGDPESSETKAIMEAHGIAFGDTVVVNVEGQKPMVVKADKEDFWTRDKAASEVIAATVEVSEPQPTELHETASLAKMMMGETAPDAVEKHEELVADAIEPLGEEALEVTLVNAEAFAEEVPSEGATPVVENKSETPPKEELIPEKDANLAGSVVNKMATMAESYRDGFEPGEGDHLQARFIKGVAHDMTEMLQKSELGAEAYAFVMGSLIGGLKEQGSMQEVAQLMHTSGDFSEEDINRVHDHFYALDRIGREAGPDADSRRSRYIFDLEQEANSMIEHNGNVPDKVALSTLGIIAGLTTHMQSQYDGGMKRYGLMEYVAKMKK
jgi:hypothetical protein